MISFDQVLLLEERVGSAVKKIEQLNAENAALRAKVAELSNALNAKSEQFSSFQSDQSKIEEGILKALSRLNAVENVVLQASGAAQSISQPSSQNSSETAPVQQTAPVAAPIAVEESPVAVQPQNSVQVQNPEPSFDSMKPSEPLSERVEEPVENPLPIPEEIEVPVSQNPQVQPQVMSQQLSEPAPVPESITPEVGFEFGETDSSAEPQLNSADQGAFQKPLEAQNPPSQPMFDIF